MKLFQFIFCLNYLLIVIDATQNLDYQQDFDDETILLSKLLNNYDPAVRPVLDSKNVITVKFSLWLVEIVDLVISCWSTLAISCY